MAFNSLIRSQVEKVFDSYLQDLAQDVKLTNKTAESYNFSTGKTTVETAKAITIKGVLLEEEKNTTNANRVSDTLLLNANDVTGFDLYDSAVINNKTYKIESFTNNGYLIEAKVSGG